MNFFFIRLANGVTYAIPTERVVRIECRTRGTVIYTDDIKDTKSTNVDESFDEVVAGISKGATFTGSSGSAGAKVG